MRIAALMTNRTPTMSNLSWPFPPLADSSDQVFDRQIDIPTGGGDEVVKDVDHRCRGFDMREVPDTGEHLESTTRHRVVSGVAMGDGNDPVLLAPNQQGR